METAVDDLPEGIEALRAALLAERMRSRELESANVRLSDQVDQLELLAEQLRHLVEQFRQLKFGKASEKLDPNQLNLAFEDVEQAIAEVQAKEEKLRPELRAKRTRERRQTRPSLPDHLPQVDVTIEPEATVCPCCGGELHKIGADVAKRLDIVPVQYRILATHRPKYACQSCPGQIVQAPAPARVIEGGLPTEALIAHVLVEKHADHKPLYRQAQAMARQGIAIHRSVIASWAGVGAGEIKPIWRLMHKDLLRSPILFADETTAPVLDPGRGRTHQGYFWTIARDPRGWGGSDPPAVVFTYAPGRNHVYAEHLLDGFRGVLQVDGYQAYSALAKKRAGAISLAHCWSHCRREYFKLAKSDGTTPLASEALRRIAEMYAIESELRGQSPEQRRAGRQAKSKPLVDAFRTWAMEQLSQTRPNAPIADALRYSLDHWDGLTRFLQDGRVEMDSNTIERAIRPICLTRKNSLFAGNNAAAENWAAVASIIETCKLLEINPQTYLTDVMTKLANLWPNDRLAELTPWAWKTKNT